MKLFFVLISVFCLSLSWSDESIWLRADGSGWGSPEYFACRDAERDAEWALERECRWEAGSNRYYLTMVSTSYCNCYETSNDYYRCRTTARGLCEIYE